MKKSITALTLVLTLLLALLAGCGGGTEPTQAPAPAETEAPATEPPSEAPEETQAPEAGGETEAPVSPVSYPLTEDSVEFTVIMGMAGFMPRVLTNEGFDGMAGVKLLEEATGVDLVFTPIDQDAYAEQFNIMLVSGEYYDFIGVPDAMYTGGIDALIADEICVDLAPHLETCLPDFYERGYLANENYAKEITSDNGAITTVWVLEDQSYSGSTIRKDWLDELNMDIPDTYDDLYEILVAFRDVLDVKYPMVMLQKWTNNNDAFNGGYEIAAFAGDGDIAYHVRDGQVIAGVTDPNYRDYVEMLNKWWSEGLIGDVSLSIVNPNDQKQYSDAGECGFWVGSSANLSDSIAATAGEGYNAVAIPELTREPGDTFKLYSNAGGKGASGGWAISTQCEDPEMAMKVINWFWTDEGIEASNYGIEGETFNYVDGEVVYTDLILNNPNGLNSTFNSCGLILFFDFPFYYTNTRLYATFDSQNQIDSQTIWRQDATDEMRYFGDLTVEESEIYGEYVSDIATYVDENISAFVVGDRPLEEWDAFIAQIESMGIEHLVEVKQAAYDRYLAR